MQPIQKSIIQVKTGALNRDYTEKVCPPFRNSSTMAKKPLPPFVWMSNFTSADQVTGSQVCVVTRKWQ